MGSSTSKYEHAHSIRNKLRDVPFVKPTENDYNFLSYQTGLSREEIMKLIDRHLSVHPDGRMNRKEFCELFIELRKESPEIVTGLSENIFKALGVSTTEIPSDLITLPEFLMTYALTSRGDLKRRLEYAFELYDTNHDNALEVDEVREIIYGILELFDKQSKENLVDVSKDCFKQMKITQVVKKSN